MTTKSHWGLSLGLVLLNCTLGNKRGEYPNIKDGVYIYPNTTIVGGIIIGENAIIGANSFVDKDVKEESCFKSGNS